MKDAISTALELSAQRDSPKPPAELSYEEARAIGARTGRSVAEVQREEAGRSAPIEPLARALSRERAADAQCGRAGADVAAALLIQGQWEKLLDRRIAILTKIARGTEALAQCVALCQDGKAGFESWVDLEQTSPLHFGIVVAGVRDMLAYERLVADLPAWIERRRADLAVVNEEIGSFAKLHGIKAE